MASKPSASRHKAKPAMADPSLAPAPAASGTGMEAAVIVPPVAMAAADLSVQPAPGTPASTPASTPLSPPASSPAMLRIRSRQEGFRRAGLVFTKAPSDIAVDMLDERQLELLHAEPMLLIEVL